MAIPTVLIALGCTICGQPVTTNPASIREDLLGRADATATRPTADLIDNLLREDNRRDIEPLVAALRTRTLAETEVNRLIDAAEKEASQAKQLYLLQALSSSESPAALRYIEKALLANPDAGRMLQFLQSVGTVSATATPLLTQLYARTDSPLVQDAILDLAFRAGAAWGDTRTTQADIEAIQATRHVLLTWFVRNASRDDHKLRALAGTYTGGGRGAGYDYALVDEFLETHKDPKVRKSAYEIVMRHYQEHWLARLLSEQETEDVQRAGLQVYRDAIANNKRPLYDDEKAVRTLRAALSGRLPEKTKRDVESILALLCRKAAAELTERYRDRRGRSVVPGRTYNKNTLRSMLERLDREMEIDEDVARLKAKFGPFPEEADVRNELETIKTQRREAIERLLEQAE